LVLFYEHRVVNIIAKGQFDRVAVDLPSVRRDLHAVHKTIRKVLDERMTGTRIAPADSPVDDQFGISIHRNPCPAIAMAFAPVLRLDVLVLAADEAPNLVKLDMLSREIADDLIVKVLRERSGIGQQSKDGDLVRAEETARCVDRIAFHEGRKDLSTLFGGQLVHARYCSNSYPTVNGEIVLDYNSFYCYSYNMPRPPKDPSLRMSVDLRIPVTAAQKELVFQAAALSGNDLAAWVRPVILRLARKEVTKAEREKKRTG